MGSTLPDPDLADGRSADTAGSALTAVNFDNKAAGLEDAINIGSPGINSLTQDRNDGGMQPARLIRQEPSRIPEWMKSGAEETLIGVNVSDAGNKCLIQQKRLELTAIARQTGRKLIGSYGQRIGSHAGRDRSGIIGQPDPAELARIIKAQCQAMIQVQRQTRVPFNRSAVRHQEQAAGHAQVNDKELRLSPRTVQGKEQVLTQPSDGGKAATFKVCWIDAV